MEEPEDCHDSCRIHGAAESASAAAAGPTAAFQQSAALRLMASAAYAKPIFANAQCDWDWAFAMSASVPPATGERIQYAYAHAICIFTTSCAFERII